LKLLVAALGSRRHPPAGSGDVSPLPALIPVVEGISVHVRYHHVIQFWLLFWFEFHKTIHQAKLHDSFRAAFFFSFRSTPRPPFLCACGRQGYSRLCILLDLLSRFFYFFAVYDAMISSL
jgi:hypothetical protein